MLKVFEISLIAIKPKSVRSVIFRIAPTSALIMDHICPQLSHVFSVNLDVIINKFFCRSILCYVCGRRVKDFYGNEKNKFLTFVYSVSYKIYASYF